MEVVEGVRDDNLFRRYGQPYYRIVMLFVLGSNCVTAWLLSMFGPSWLKIDDLTTFIYGYYSTFLCTFFPFSIKLFYGRITDIFSVQELKRNKIYAIFWGAATCAFLALIFLCHEMHLIEVYLNDNNIYLFHLLSLVTILYYLGCYFLFNVIALAHFPANAGNNHRNVVPGPAPNLFSTIENEKIYLVLCGASTIITAWISELILSNVEKDSFSAFLAGYSLSVTYNLYLFICTYAFDWISNYYTREEIKKIKVNALWMGLGLIACLLYIIAYHHQWHSLEIVVLNPKLYLIQIMCLVSSLLGLLCHYGFCEIALSRYGIQA